uniref:Flagellar motor protein MotB n=1 Tax=Schlesneria paludicola TaxID=360056 RepID=A0A7C4QR45_9PLAN
MLSFLLRLKSSGLTGLLCLLLCSCRGASPYYLQQSQLRAQQLYLQNRNLALQNQALGQMAAERAQLEQQNMALKANLDLANQRLQNLQSANEQLENKFRTHLTASPVSPLNSDQTRRLEELRQKYPEFEFDPHTGVSKFSTDLLFASGKDEITPRSQQILAEFARIMNQPDVQNLKILVVGHTDNKPIGKPHTRAEHPTNWHLSTDRANAVVLALRKHGIAETRMGATGYGEWQPIASNATEEGRQRNRRVEIFVLAPEASIAGWEDHTPLK